MSNPQTENATRNEPARRYTVEIYVNAHGWHTFVADLDRAGAERIARRTVNKSRIVETATKTPTEKDA